MALQKYSLDLFASDVTASVIEAAADVFHAYGTSEGVTKSWDTRGRGHKITGSDLEHHLASLSKTSIPAFVKHSAEILHGQIDSRFFSSRQMTKLRIADKLAIHPLAVANYNEAHRFLEFRKDASTGEVLHELAHHLDIAFLRSPEKQSGDNVRINASVAKKVIDDYTSEYKQARDKISSDLGRKFNWTNDNAKVKDTSGFPTIYAVASSKEWFAESFWLYTKGGASRERLERIAPKTSEAIKTVLSGKVFK